MAKRRKSRQSPSGKRTTEVAHEVAHEAVDEVTYDYDDGFSGGFKPHLRVSEQKDRAAKERVRLESEGISLNPVKASSRQIAKSFWGRSWCSNLERYHDYASRLPRGRTYIRSGCVLHLEITQGKVAALVKGAELYDVEIDLAPLDQERWSGILAACEGKVGSVVDLLGGRFSDALMEVLTDETKGLFPEPAEIRMSCNCLDWANMCKHAAAALYGVGVRLDEKPELFFTLRGVDHGELVEHAASALVGEATEATRDLDPLELEELFGIDIALDP